MAPDKLAHILHERISDFGEKPSYVLFPEELVAGLENGLLAVFEEVDRGDGTIITKVIFEGKFFICAKESTKAATR
ncbi:MAG: hypothetical protein PHV99_03830 [Candidatus Pacebacteria bacterium]|nr:hypothetical protein [Candidatus Paceibacterota bacterium]